ncbi:MAG: hypothetical protein PUC18_12625 [Prevotellaceae bacterium]|nr:hypothetical protein [Prevotellaceae bacterium]
MLITTQNEIVSLMPTARWDRPEQLLGYLEEEERVALEPLLGTALYQWLLTECDRLRKRFVDITSTTIKPTGKAKTFPGVAYADVTEKLELIHNGMPYSGCDAPYEDEYEDVSNVDLVTVRLIRICQQIEFYKMLSHKAGLLNVSFNEGGGMNMVSADGYEPADEKRIERMVKDAWMSAGRAVDSLLLFLEADAKGEKMFTEKWKEADAFYLHKDLLFQTARVLNEYLDIKGERMAYVMLVRDIRFCQNTYLKPRVGGKLLKAVVEWANNGAMQVVEDETDGNNENDENGVSGENNENENDGMNESNEDEGREEAMEELLGMLRTALAFYVESRRTELAPVKEKLARRDSMTDAQQAMAMACQWIEDNLDALGDAAVDTPIYNAVRARKEQEERDKASACAAAERRRREACEQSRKKLFTSFPATHRTPELK